MFQSMLDSRVGSDPRSLRSVGLAFGLHAAVLAAAVVTSYLLIGKITPPDAPDILHFYVPPPPPDGGGNDHPAALPPPRRGSTHAPRPDRPAEPVQPRVVEQNVVAPTPPPTMPNGPMDLLDVNAPEVPGSGAPGEGPGGDGTGGNGKGPGDGTGPGIGDGPPGPGIGTGPIYVDGSVRRPVLLVKVQPDYPETARRAKLEGDVVVEAVISRDGSVEDVKLLRSTNPIFVAAAMDAVRHWRYSPATQNGMPVKVYFTVEVRFVLQ